MAPTALACQWSRAIIISEVWPLNQGIVLPQKFFLNLCTTIRVMAQNAEISNWD
jgi:hypothetical protein